MSQRPSVDELGVGAGKRTRLMRILFDYGARNGTGLFLPYDQGLEHGPRDFFSNPASSDPRYVIQLAVEGAFNGIVLQIGLARKFMWEFAGQVPLIVKLNGKTEIPPDDEALSSVHAGVEEAVRMGADAVGYTLYVGSPAYDQDFRQLRTVREAADRFGMPLIVWAYPRGSAVAAKGGADSFYAVDYAARVASEVGADVVKLNFPHPEKLKGVREEYTHRVTEQEAVDAVVRSANRTLVLIAGGSRVSDEATLEKARMSMEAGATGLIFGRNVWQRPHDESLRLVSALREILDKYPSP
jgi:fructose-bisphosphate aldolase, class I